MQKSNLEHYCSHSNVWGQCKGIRHVVALATAFAALFMLPAVSSALAARAASPEVEGSVNGTVTDSTGAVVIGAKVEIHNAITHYSATTLTDKSGAFHFKNLPFNPYHVSVTAQGFSEAHQDVDLRSGIPATLNFSLQLSAAVTNVTVHAEASDLIEKTPMSHTDLGEETLTQLPVEDKSIGLSSAITLGTPGVVADSNGMFHPMGEHADTTISLDGQPISDQQSKIYSNQPPLDIFQSMEVVNGVAPAEDGDKSSLVVNAQTKSGLGQKPQGTWLTDYGSFGTVNQNLTYGAGTDRWGNFVAVNGENTGRYMDSPEFTAMHDYGNNENVFDRIDFQPDPNDTLHLNLFGARTWFQVPNTYPQQFSGQDQRQEVYTLDFAPGWTRVLSPNTIFTFSPYARQDYVHYYPSANPFADTPATVGESRHLLDLGGTADIAYSNGRHNAKAGIEVNNTVLSENFDFGLTDPTFNPVCLTPNNAPVTNPTILSTAQCAPAGYQTNPNLLPGLVRYDLSRGGVPFQFAGHGDIREEALYAQDAINLGNLTVNAGVRGDNYNGLTSNSALEPRVGLAYLFKQTSTVLRASYGRFLETPFNENLLLSSETGVGGLAASSGAFGQVPLRPGIRDTYDIGLEQPIGTRFTAQADYFWKFTGPDFDFDTLFNTPIIFPIEWSKSKISGLIARLNFPSWKGFTADTVLGHVVSRFFPPETGGIIFNSPLNTGVFRIDHDEALEQTTQVEYHIRKKIWTGFTWRYDSGMVAGAIPDFANALTLSPDNQQAIGLYCGNVFATLTAPLTSCSSPVFGATRITIPAAGTYNPDHNPTRVAPRHLFDVALGDDSLYHNERFTLTGRLTATNITNQDVLYNFLSTFSGTHFVEPRAFMAEIGVNF